MQTTTTKANQLTNDADAVNAAIAAVNNRVTLKASVPTAIHFICIITAMGVVILAISLFIGFSLMGILSQAYNLAILVANLLSIIWMWQMQKKGAYLYAGLFVVGQALLWRDGNLFGIHLTSVADCLIDIIAWLSGAYMEHMISVKTIVSVISATATAIVLFYSRRMR